MIEPVTYVDGAEDILERHVGQENEHGALEVDDVFELISLSLVDQRYQNWNKLKNKKPN